LTRSNLIATRMYTLNIQTLQEHAKRLRCAPALKATRRIDFNDLSVDYSRQWLDSAAQTALSAHARSSGFEAWRDDLALGNIVNITENQAATHMHCRAALVPHVNHHIPAVDLVVYAERAEQFLRLADDFRAGKLKGATGQVLTHYVHLGIGGSDLGPRCVVQALDGLPQLDTAESVSFISNLDPDDFAKNVRHLNPATTLFGVASKSFMTLETQANANLAKAWLQKGLGLDSAVDSGLDAQHISAHFCAMTASPDKASQFLGFTPEQAKSRILLMSQTVGGRYSLWSCIGLPIAIAFGRTVFTELCEGAAQIDHHFFGTHFSDNLPAQVGAMQFWNATVLGMRCQPTIAYSQRLGLLPAHLQQLDMESNGKSTARDGTRLSYPTSPALLTGVGTHAQHAFFQWFHQSHDDTASVFIGLNAQHHAPNSLGNEYANDVVRCLNAQADVLWCGGETKKAGVFGNHGVYPGGRPVTVITLKQLTPKSIGALIATFEHAVYTAAVLWGINSFDQWGVELGKQLYANDKKTERPT
jgi:glucose-6-phosphate isomerase